MGDVRGGCCLTMDLFRSELMRLVQLIIPMESTHLTVSYLGDLGPLQFKDIRTMSFTSQFGEESISANLCWAGMVLSFQREKDVISYNARVTVTRIFEAFFERGSSRILLAFPCNTSDFLTASPAVP